MTKYLVSIAVLALAIGAVLIGCQNPSTPSGPVITGNYVFTGSDGNEYVLVIFDDGTYILATAKDGKEVTSTGTYKDASDGTKTLSPTTGSGTIVVVPKAGGGADITVGGEITFTDQDGKDAGVTLPEGNTAAEDKKPGQNSLVITGLEGVYKNETKVYVGAEESKAVDNSSNLVEGTVTNGSLTVPLDIKNGSYYIGFSPDGIIIFISKTTAAFIGGTVSKVFADVELYTSSVKLGDIGLTSSMTMNAVIQAMSEGRASDYATWKTVMQQIISEEFGDGYVSLNFLDIALYKDAGCAQEFSGTDTVGPATVIYTKFSLTEIMSGGGSSSGDPIKVAGYVTGTIEFTGYTGKRPEVGIQAYLGNRLIGGEIGGDPHAINTNGSFSIPFTQESLTVLQTVLQLSEAQDISFRLVIGSISDGNYYDQYIIKQVTASQLSGGKLDVGSLGTMSIGSITLSGTITTTYNGQIVPLISVSTSVVKGDYSHPYYGYLTSPGPNTPWSIFMPAFDSPTDIRLSVNMFDSDLKLFFTKDAVLTVSGVYNIDVTGINLDINAVTLNGTIDVTLDGQQPYEITIVAYTEKSDNVYAAAIGRTSKYVDTDPDNTWSMIVTSSPGAMVYFYINAFKTGTNYYQGTLPTTITFPYTGEPIPLTYHGKGSV
jgi:hypothetical protein